jgi:AraC family transcriptional regulator
VLFRPAGEKHSDRFLSVETSCVIIEVSDVWLKRIDSFGRMKTEPCLSSSPQTSRLAADLYIQSLYDDAAAGLAMEGLTYALAAEFLREGVSAEGNSYPPRWLRRLREELSENPGCCFTLSDLAESAGVHPVHLSRQFRRYYGEPLWEFLRRRRVEIGAQRILSERGTLCEIAHSLGFSEQAHFTRTFRRFMGVTPSEFRRRQRNASSEKCFKGR